MKKLLFLICILGVSISLQAQGKPSAWANLNNLHQGDRIQVRQMDSTKATGEFMSVSDAALSLQANGSAQVIARETVKSVTLMKNKHRLRNTFIGAGIGAGLGAALGGATNNGFVNRGVFAAGVAAAFSVPGAVVGALVPDHSTIYNVGSH